MANAALAQYDEQVYDNLSLDDQVLVIRPRLINDGNELRRVWSILHSLNIRGKLLDSWVLHLPALYDHILIEEDLEWLWGTDSEVIPDSLEDDWIPSLVKSHRLYTVHVVRARVAQLGLASVPEYKKRYIDADNVYSDCRFSDGPEFFEEVPTKDEHEALFVYNREKEYIQKLILIDRESYSQRNRADSPLALRYVLERWRSGRWTTYQKRCTTLLKYATSLVRGIYVRTHGSDISSLPCYSKKREVDDEAVPSQLRDSVELLILNLSNTPNEQFLRNYYRAAAEHILSSLHAYSMRDPFVEMIESTCSLQ